MACFAITIADYNIIIVPYRRYVHIVFLNKKTTRTVWSAIVSQSGVDNSGTHHTHSGTHHAHSGTHHTHSGTHHTHSGTHHTHSGRN